MISKNINTSLQKNSSLIQSMLDYCLRIKVPMGQIQSFKFPYLATDIFQLQNIDILDYFFDDVT
jgi:hypothetical protein